MELRCPVDLLARPRHHIRSNAAQRDFLFLCTHSGGLEKMDVQIDRQSLVASLVCLHCWILSDHCKSLLKRVKKNSSDEFIATDEDPGRKKLTEGEGETIMINPRPVA